VDHRLFKADGTAAGREHALGLTTADNQTSVTPATLADGRGVAAWTDFSGQLGDASVSGVTDFRGGQGDRLLLYGSVPGDLACVGTTGFSGGGAEARFGQGWVVVDVDGDGLGDLATQLEGITAADLLSLAEFVIR
jgi:hypothetical protein